MDSRDSRASAEFLTHLLGLPSPTTWGPFHAVAVSNAVTLDYLDTTESGGSTPAPAHDHAAASATGRAGRGVTVGVIATI